MEEEERKGLRREEGRGRVVSWLGEEEEEEEEERG